MYRVGSGGISRLAVAVLAAGVLTGGALASAGAAFADESASNAGGASATLGGPVDGAFQVAFVKQDGRLQRTIAGLYGMKLDNGGRIQTYCVDIHQPAKNFAKYQEVPWKSSSLESNPDAGKINWILENSYPNVTDLNALARAAGVDNGRLTAEQAAAGTQVAIWRFSDHLDVTAEDKRSEKLADYLQENATHSAEPDASLSLNPPAVSGKSGEKLGPVTVSTNAGSVQIATSPGTPAGVKLVDKKGSEVTSAKDGDDVFFDVPAGTPDGTTSLTAKASTKVPVGRVFTSGEGDKRSQTQIVAGSTESSVTSTATANWAAKGPIPAAHAVVNCAKGGVDVTVSNEGDKPFAYTVDDKELTVQPGGSETTTVPVGEDEAYKIVVKGANGFEETFEGVRDCETASTTGGGGTTGGSTDTPGTGTSTSPSGGPSAASTGGSSGSGETTGGDLAQTGGSSATPLIAGIALVLVAVGGGAVFFLRKKSAPQAP
ncbi:thioester domain-containing protein [Streptomyces sp. NPDC005811]|uniref:thioester domain-containing protein n=1 Tax=Streptomyces sp. NPDC005811 TaxID=3154565 RepID=UPI00340B873F